jgi:hypothetical protein
MDSILRNTVKVKLSSLDIEQLPNHKIKSAKEWSSACPVCQGDDRFLFWPADGNYWCRQCELAGFVDQEAQSGLTEDQLADIERRKRQAKQAEIDRKRTALERLQAKRNDLIYHRNLNGNSGYVQRKWGITEDTINGFKIGYCNAIVTLAPPVLIPIQSQFPIIGMVTSLICAIVLAPPTVRRNINRKPSAYPQRFSTPMQ